MKHRVIIVGCGGMSIQWIDYALERENADIVALVDMNVANAENVRGTYGLKVPIYANLSEAIENTDATLVFDVTIPASHKNITTTAIKAGLTVFGEKPIAETLEDAYEVVDLAVTRNVVYAVMQNRRYNHQLRALKQALQKGIVGRVGALHADFFLGPHFGGFRETMNSPLIIDMAIHTFDQARCMIGADPVSVYCHEYNPPGSWYQGNASAVCIFEMDNGAVFTYRGSWSAVGAGTSWEASWRVHGSEGTALWDGTNVPSYERLKGEQQEAFIPEYEASTITPDDSFREGHRGCLDEMFAALEQGRLAETHCRSNIKSMEMVFGAIQSAKEQRKIILKRD
ncbi:Gfo/Idh/MocA family protein [Litoribacterium kuwaitense]|uniref:Gfo/Idh/MocA family protein n=1 Tax=Litoribacterium kuwaitense TaxID=1398745 RepID=UPI001BAC072D|nr:Gfo/Idh/MocA family oxidoreductase [Litoribacterium kuwaitense]